MQDLRISLVQGDTRWHDPAANREYYAGLVAPLVVWPQATGGEPDPARLLAALAALAIGAASRSVLGAIAGGMAMLYAALAVVG